MRSNGWIADSYSPLQRGGGEELGSDHCGEHGSRTCVHFCKTILIAPYFLLSELIDGAVLGDGSGGHRQAG